MRLVLWCTLTLALVILSQHIAPVAAADIAPSPVTSPQPGRCASKCGEVDIPYPFGIDDDNCSWQGSFTVTCNHSFSPPRPYVGNVEVINITVETGEMRVYTKVSYICYNSSRNIDSVEELSFNLTETPLRISSTHNVFTAIGCNTLALLNGREDWSYFTGCISYCPSLEEAANDGDICTGLGCCQTRIPSNLDMIAVNWNNGSLTDNPAWTYSPCSNAFVAAQEWYNFKRQDLRGNESYKNQVGDRTIPMVLDWAIQNYNGSCQPSREAGGKPTAPACASINSYCVNVTHGYLCNCSEGYQGNPYIKDGCTDINECNSTKNGPCGFYSKCKNTEGGYICKCNINRQGDGKSEKGCYHYKVSPYAILAVAIVGALFLGCVVIVLVLRRKLKKRFYKNGGDLLKSLDIKMYSKGDLKKITKSYSKRLGSGNFGDVYMGTAGTQEVAVKRANKETERKHKKLRPAASQQQEGSWKDGFVTEITFQCQINKHPNVVHLVGCCLETDVPILVFEFIRKGNLQVALHGDVDKPSCPLSLLQRLDIAIGSAEGVAHMHSHQHIHGDIKPANILLDENFNPKVSDFGSSKLLSANRYAREVAADREYADPVYRDTNRFMEKSDVYSFGVVLLELITRKKAIIRYDAGGSQVLVIDFKKAFKYNGNGQTMYDAEILPDGHAHSHGYIECLHMVGKLAVRCLNCDDLDDRPEMAEVLEVLKQAKKLITTDG